MIKALLLILSPAFAAYEDLGAGARAISMGNAFTAISDDAQAGYYNPAGLAGVRRPEFLTSYGRLHLGMDDGSSLSSGYAAYAHPLKDDRGSLSVSWSNMSLSGAYQEHAFRASYGKRLNDLFSVGASVKWLMLTIAQDEYTARDPVFDYGGKDKVSAVALDLGACMRLPGPYRLGAALTDVNRPDIGFSSPNRLPVGFKIGAARLGETLNLAMDLGYKDRDIKVMTGGEKLLSDRVWLRGGLAMGSRQFANVSLGFGLVERLFRIDYAFLYPVSGLSGTAGSHRLGVSIPFGEIPRESKFRVLVSPSEAVEVIEKEPPKPEPKPVVKPKPPPEPVGPIRHTVKAGDNLKSLALRYFGNAEKWLEIYDMNKRSIGPEGELTVGQVLIIPEGGRR